MIPKLREVQETLSAHREAKNLQKFVEEIDKLIADIESDMNPPELRSLK